MTNYIYAFLTSAAIAVSFRGPLRAVPASGLAGLLGYLSYDLIIRYQGSMMLASFVGALLVGATGEFMARRLKQPSTLFVVPGLFPLLPGLMAYNGMLLLAQENWTTAAQMLSRTAFYTGCLAAGMALPPAVMRRNRPR